MKEKPVKHDIELEILNSEVDKAITEYENDKWINSLPIKRIMENNKIA